MAKQLWESINRYQLNHHGDTKQMIEDFANEYSLKRFEYINKSLSALEIVIKVNKGIPPDYIWNKIAYENGYMSNVSIEYLLEQNWRDLGRLLNKGVKLIPKSKKS